MPKVRVFKDRRHPVDTHVRHRPETNSMEQAEGVGQDDDTPVPKEEGVLLTAQQPSLITFATPSMPAPVRPDPYFITVPGVEEIMARVHARANQLGIRSSVMPTALSRSCHLKQARQTLRQHHRRPMFHPVTAASLNTTARHPQQGVIRGPTEIQLRGYAGLEGLSILGAIMRHPRINSIHSFHYRFNDPENPAGILLIDPLNARDGEIDRYCPFTNKDAISWLYVRRHGDAVWTRDFMAPRGSGRHAVYLQRCRPGFKWEQQLGDLLDTRKSLNLWVAVKIE